MMKLELLEESITEPNNRQLLEYVLKEFSWEEYEGILDMFILGLQDEKDLTSIPPEKLQEKMQKALTKRLSSGPLRRSITLFNKRDILIPHAYIQQLGRASKRLYDQYVDVIKKYDAGNYGAALAIAMNVQIQVRGLPGSEERLLFSILLSDIYSIMSRRVLASPLCLECADSTDLPSSSPIRGAALSMLGDIAFGKRLYALALLKYNEAKEIWNDNSQWSCLSITQSDISRTLFYMDHYVEALSEITEAITTAKTLENFDPLAYCLLTEIELASLMRNTDLAERKLKEYNSGIASNSSLHNSHWEMMILAKHHVESSNFTECVKELLYVCLLLKEFEKHEHLPDVMVMLASYHNYEAAYGDAISCLLECYDLHPELTSYRFGLFLQWLHTMEIALRGNHQSELANAASVLIVRFLNNNILEVKNTILGRTGWWQNLTLLDEFIDELHGLTPRYFRRHGLRIDLNSGHIYLASKIESVHTLTDDQIKVFRQFALHPDVSFKNLEIIRSYRPEIADYYDSNPAKKDEIPRRDNHYITLFRKLFLRLCGNRLIENRPGSGYYIPKL